jgi:hypothetical protein
MYVLLIQNAYTLDHRRWRELHRLGRVHFGYNAYGQPETYLELPYPRRQTAREYKQMLPPYGIEVSGTYRDLPAYDVTVPVWRLLPDQWRPTMFGADGDYGHILPSAITCTWCEQGPFHFIHYLYLVSSPQHYETHVFCPTCRRLARVYGKVPTDEWPDLAAYLSEVPRIKPDFNHPESVWREDARKDLRKMSPQYKRNFGIGGISKAKGLVDEES